MAQDSGKKGGLIGSVMPFALLAIVGLGSGYVLAMMQGQPAAEIEAPAAKEASSASTQPDSHGASTPTEDGHGKAKTDHAETADAAEEVPLEEVEPDMSELVAVPCPPVTTNLREPATTWIRLEGHLLVRKDAEKTPEKLAMESAQQVLAYLRTISLAELQGSTGLYTVSADLNDIVRGASEGNVRKLLISGLIVE